MNYDDEDMYSIETYAKRIEGFTLKDATENIYELNLYNKGQLGHLIEREYFGYALNSRIEPDFEKVGVELKVAPLKKIKMQTSSPLLIKRLGLSAKERIVLSIINYENLVKEEWKNASVLNKIKLLLMFYIYDNEVNIDEQLFYLVSLWTPSNKDMNVIKEDWKLIKNKIMQGKAHEISEGDTMFLGACTKGANKSSLKTQPFSSIPAMQRAFSLKRSYVDFIVEELLQENRNQKLKTEVTIERSSTFVDVLFDSISQNRNMSVQDIIEKYKLTRKRIAKHFLQLITTDFLDVEYGEPVKKMDDFNKANIEIKCILLNIDGIPKESMSFEQIQYKEIIMEEWDESSIRDKFENKKHLWVVYQATRKYNTQSELDLSEIILKDTFFWNMPIRDLDMDYYLLWKDTVEKIKAGIYNDFMKLNDNKVGHIRPKGINKNDVMLTVQGTYERKKSFWLNNKYIAEQIKNNQSRS